MPKISIRFGGYQNPDSIHNQSAIFFGEKLKEYFKDNSKENYFKKYNELKNQKIN
jgi:hypothetical protein